MLAAFHCPACGSRVELTNPVAPGTTVGCPHCSTSFPAPADRPDLSSRLPEYLSPIEPAGKGSLLRLIMVGLVLVVVAAFAAWVWPGFLKSTSIPTASGNEDPVAYLPARSPLYIGLEVGALKQLEHFNRLLERINLGMVGSNAASSSQSADLLVGAEKILIAANLSQGEALIVVKTGQPYTLKEAVASFNLKGEARRENGKLFYDLPDTLPRRVGPAPGPKDKAPAVFVGMPNDRILLFGRLPEQAFLECLTSDGSQPTISGQTLELIRKLGGHSLWAVYRPDSFAKTAVAHWFTDSPRKVDAAIHQVDVVTVAMTVDVHIRVKLCASCATAGATADLKGAVEDFWNNKKPLLATLARFAGPAIHAAFDEIADSLQFSAHGTIAQLSLRIGSGSLTKALNEAAKKFSLTQFLGGR
jgi:hypothetical protein